MIKIFKDENVCTPTGGVNYEHLQNPQTFTFVLRANMKLMYYKQLNNTR